MRVLICQRTNQYVSRNAYRRDSETMLPMTIKYVLFILRADNSLADKKIGTFLCRVIKKQIRAAFFAAGVQTRTLSAARKLVFQMANETPCSSCIKNSFSSVRGKKLLTIMSADSL